MQAPVLDEIDEVLIKCLLNDARATLKDMSIKAKISTNSVYNRVAKLRSNGIITGSTILFDPRALGNIYAASLEMSVDVEHQRNILEALRAHPRVIMCFEGVGQCDIFVIFGGNCMAELDAFKMMVRSLQGVRNIAMSVRVDEFEFLYDNLDLIGTEGSIDG